MIALVVVKIYAVTLSIGFSRRFSPKSGFWGIKGGLLTLGTCPPKGVFTITFLTHVSNFRKIGQKLWSLSWTKRFADTHTHTHTDKHSSDFISVQCHELHWTDNNYQALKVFSIRILLLVMVSPSLVAELNSTVLVLKTQVLNLESLQV